MTHDKWVRAYRDFVDKANNLCPINENQLKYHVMNKGPYIIKKDEQFVAGIMYLSKGLKDPVFMVY